MAFIQCRALLPMRSNCLTTGAFRSLYTTSSAMAPSMKVVSFQEPTAESHEAKNLRLNRPLSPHLLIYKPQVTSMLSISHRGTGLALSCYISALGIGALVLPSNISSYIDALEAAQPGSGVLFLMKLVVAYPLAYHFANGIRHLTWDTGKCLTIKGVYNSGYLMLAVSAVLTIILASL